MASQIGCHRNRRDEKERARPGIIMAVQTFGAGLKSHVHFHILIIPGPQGKKTIVAGKMEGAVLLP